MSSLLEFQQLQTEINLRDGEFIVMHEVELPWSDLVHSLKIGTTSFFVFSVSLHLRENSKSVSNAVFFLNSFVNCKM